MKRVTVAISDDLKERLRSVPHINWPQVIKEGFKEHVDKLEKLGP